MVLRQAHPNVLPAAVLADCCSALIRRPVRAGAGHAPLSSAQEPVGRTPAANVTRHNPHRQCRRYELARWLKVGFLAALALLPGTSRSGATFGGMLFGLSRVAATGFSFFLGILTLFAAPATK
jgi:undecaprenyl pyrophosphate phosphatase UppP